MGAMGEMSVVYVCCGSKCKGRKKARKELIAALELVARLEHVDCQKICSGPVAGFEVAGKLEWFSELRKGKARGKLVTLIEEGKLTKSLQKRWVKKRSGKKRGCCGVAELPQSDGAAAEARTEAVTAAEHATEAMSEAPDTVSEDAPFSVAGE